jgi:hypothetical protein
MIRFLACKCGEIHPSALVERDIGYVCLNCEARADGKPLYKCFVCGDRQPRVKHHVDGVKHSKITTPMCVNCHHKLHRGEEVTPIAVKTIRRKLKAA